MAMFKWSCVECKNKTVKILKRRPKLDPCTACGGKQMFDSGQTDTNVIVLETLDNGMMARRVTRVYGIEEKLAERNREKKDPEII